MAKSRTPTAALVILLSMLPEVLAGAAETESWSVRFAPRSAAREFKPVIKTGGVRIESLGSSASRRGDELEHVSLYYRLDGAISSLAFDYSLTGDAARMPLQLLDVTGRELWSYHGQGRAPEQVMIDGLKTRGLVVFRTSRARGAKLSKGWSHEISNLTFTEDASKPVVDGDGFTIVDTLDELRGYASAAGMKVRMKPGLYKLNTALSQHFIEFTGHDNHWDLSGVTISASLDLFRAFGRDDGFYCAIDLSGDRNTLEGLTVRNHGEGYGTAGRNKLFNISGSDCLVRNVTARTSGSHPWGYGSLFGISGRSIRKMNGIRIGHPARNTRLVGSRVHMRAMGHAIFVQGATNTLIEDCRVDGLLRLTDEILAETSGYAFDREFEVPGYGEGVQIGPDRLVPPKEIVSLSEDGIRMYPGGGRSDTGPTIIRNCIVTNMRRGICTGLSEAPDEVVNCEVRNCIAAGFNIGSRDSLVDCRADARYAEALCVPYLHSEAARVDLHILDSRKRLANDLLAKINGRNHHIELQTSDPAFVPNDMGIELASEAGYGSFQRGERKANGVRLHNQTSAHVTLRPGATGNTITTPGPVTDLGEENTTTRPQE